MLHRSLGTCAALGTLLAMLTAAPASATSISYTTTLLGANEVPANASPATGVAIVTLDDVLNMLSVDETFSGLIGGTAAAAHIHCCVPVGVNTGVAVPFIGFPAAASGHYVHAFDLTLLATYSPAFVTSSGGTAASAEAALIAGLNSGLAYANIHDGVYPGGEIRGQLAVAAVPEPASLLLVGSGLVWAVRRRKSQTTNENAAQHLPDLSPRRINPID